MKKIIILVYILCAGIWTSHAQVRIVNSANNIQANNSPAFIDASSNPTVNNPANTNVGKGLIWPRVDLTAMIEFPGPNPGIPNNFPTLYDGMVVYNTASSGIAGVGSTEGTLSPGFWYYENKSETSTGGTWKPLGGISAEVDGIVGNEVTGATESGGLERAGLGTEEDPYTLGIADAGVTSAKIAANAVTSAHILDGTVAAADIANHAITSDHVAPGSITHAKLSDMGAASGDVLTYNNGWAPLSPVAVKVSVRRTQAYSVPTLATHEVSVVPINGSQLPAHCDGSIGRASHNPLELYTWSGANQLLMVTCLAVPSCDYEGGWDSFGLSFICW